MINTVILHNHKWITSQQEGHELEQLTGYDFDIHEQVRVYVDRKNKNYWMWADIADGVRKNFVVALDKASLKIKRSKSNNTLYIDCNRKPDIRMCEGNASLVEEYRDRILRDKLENR